MSSPSVTRTPDLLEVSQLPVVRPDNFAFTEEHARGGLGRILRARDRRLNRTVAVKVLLRTGTDSARRFLREVQLTARLQHPSIIPVHEAGRWPTGEPFYTMKLVSGRSLKQAIDETRTFAERIALLSHVVSVADALAYAHSERIIHRDIKPANVMVGAFGETVVIDWGLAKEITASSSGFEATEAAYREETGGETVAGTVVGTPAYMPPEQARGEPVDERADVYSLGAMLYHVLSGKPPYQASSSNEILTELLARSPEPLVQREPRVPGDLLAIVQKAMARDPVSRYPSALELAEDLKRFQEGSLVSAHRYSARQLTSRWLRRYRLVISIVAISLVMFATFGILSVNRIVEERNQARRERQQAQLERNKVILAHARESLLKDPTASVAWLKHLTSDMRDHPTVATLIADARARGVAKKVIRVAKTGGVAAIALSPDETMLITVTTFGEYTAWQLPDVVHVAHTHGSSSGPVTFSPDGSTVIVADDNGPVKLWRPRENHEETITGHTNLILLAQFTPDGRGLVTAGQDAEVRFTTAGSHESRVLYKHQDTIRSLDLSPSGTKVVTASDDGTFKIFDIGAQRRPAMVADEHRKPVFAVAFASENRVVSGHADGSIALWDEQGHNLVRKRLQQQQIDHFRVSHGGAFVMSITADGDVTQIQLPSFAVTHVGIRGFIVTNTALDEKPSIFAAGSADGHVRITNLARGSSHELMGHASNVTTIAFAPKSGVLYTSSLDGTVRIWPIHADYSRVLYEHKQGLLDLRPSPDRRYVATCGRDRRVMLLDVDAHAVVHLGSHNDLVYALAFSPDNRQLASVGWDKMLKLWDLRSGALVGEKVFEDHPSDVIFAEPGALYVLLPDGSIIRGSPRNTWEPFAHLTSGQAHFVSGVASPGIYVINDAHELRGLQNDGTLTLLDTGVGTLSGDFYSKENPNGHLELLDLRTRALIGTTDLPFPAARIAVAGRQVLVFDRGEHVALWDLDMRTATTLTMRALRLQSVAVSDMKLALNGDGSLAVLDFGRRSMRIFREYADIARVSTNDTSIAISHSECSAIIGASDGRVIEWDLPQLRDSLAERDLGLEEITDYQVASMDI